MDLYLNVVFFLIVCVMICCKLINLCHIFDVNTFIQVVYFKQFLLMPLIMFVINIFVYPKYFYKSCKLL